MAKEFANTKKNAFLASIPRTAIETSDIASRCKFNLSFFDPTQEAGQDFADWNGEAGSASLASLMTKIKEFTNEPLTYWMGQRAGAGGLKVLSVYASFPEKSKFKHPVHVPHDVSWARFRLGNKVRLIGFLIPERFSGSVAKVGGKEFRYDSNTFYVVFLDKEHAFYSAEAE